MTSGTRNVIISHIPTQSAWIRARDRRRNTMRADPNERPNAAFVQYTYHTIGILTTSANSSASVFKVDRRRPIIIIAIIAHAYTL